MQDIYEVPITLKNGTTTTLQTFKGKTLMIVNIASKCGLTKQLASLQALYDTFKEQNFEIIGVPSSDFMGQEPLEGEAINQFCEVNFGCSFTILGKTHVKGKQACQLFQYLNKTSGVPPFWNFQKYLISPEGKYITYYMPFTQPNSSKIIKKIESLVKKIG